MSLEEQVRATAEQDGRGGGEHDRDHQHVDADVEHERRCDRHVPEERGVELDLAVLEQSAAGHERRQRGAGSDEQTDTEHGPGLHPGHGAHVVDATRYVDERHRRGGHETADEAAARLVVPGKQQVHRQDQRGREDQPHRGVDDHRSLHSSASSALAGDRRPTRASATTPTAATASTEISPNVSRPRKSTSTTSTTLRPSASGSDISTSFDEIGVATRAPLAISAKQKTPTATALATKPRNHVPTAGVGRSNRSGRCRRTNMKTTIDRVSTPNWVSARSGAPCTTNSTAIP